MSAAARRLDQQITRLAVNDAPAAPRTPMPTTVRIAMPADAQRVFDLFMMAGDENAMLPISETKVWEGIGSAVNRKGAVIGIIDGKGGEIAGAIAIMMASFWYSSAWFCQDMLNFVHPDYRAGSLNCAKDLIQFAKWWSEQLGVPLVMGVMSNHRTEGKVRLYRRAMTFVGGVFMYRGGA